MYSCITEKEKKVVEEQIRVLSKRKGQKEKRMMVSTYEKGVKGLKVFPEKVHK
jgi:hypothetical protein